MDQYHITIKSDGSLDRRGIVTPGGTKVIAINEEALVYRVPGHRYWSGQGMPWKYAPAKDVTVVRAVGGMKFDPVEPEGIYYVQELISAPVKVR
jgi:hypothetical protein